MSMLHWYQYQEHRYHCFSVYNGITSKTTTSYSHFPHSFLFQTYLLLEEVSIDEKEEKHYDEEPFIEIEDLSACWDKANFYFLPFFS